MRISALRERVQCVQQVQQKNLRFAKLCVSQHYVREFNAMRTTSATEKSSICQIMRISALRERVQCVQQVQFD